MSTHSHHLARPQGLRRRLRRHLLVCAISQGLALAALPAIANEATHGATAARKTFSIPAGPLEPALNRFGREAGILLSYPSELTTGLNSPGLSGQASVSEGLTQLLRSSGLAAVAQADGGWTLIKQAPSSVSAPVAANALPLIAVRAGAQQEQASAPVLGYLARRGSSATKTDTPIVETPQSISVVTRDAMDARGVFGMVESLEYAPGFTPMTYGQDERYDWSTVRGIGDTYNGQFRDGLKEKGSLFAVPATHSYGVERVEFLRGPASLLFGSTVPGGVVNSITKRPTPETRGELLMRVGSQDRRGLAADLSGPLNADIGYRLVAAEDRYTPATPKTSKQVSYLAPALSLALGPSTELLLLANLRRDRIDGDPYPFSHLDAIGHYVPGSEPGWDRFHRDQWSAGFLLEHRFSEQVRLHSRARQTSTKVDMRRARATAMLSPTLVEREARYIKDSGKIWHADNYIEASWGDAAWRNTTVAGIDHSRLDSDLYRGDAATTDFDLSQGRGVGPFIEPELAGMQFGKTRQTGLYLQNQAKIAGRFVIVTGLRQDRVRGRVDGEWAEEPVRENKLTGRLGGVWLLDSGWAPYISYSTSFEPLSGSTRDGRPFKPTEGRQFEIGLRYEPAQTPLRLTAALFDIKQRNVLSSDPVDPDYSVQRGEIGSRGLELEATASLPGSLDLSASYSYTDARITRDTDASLIGLRNGLVPRHKLTTWIDWRLPAGIAQGLGLGLGLRHNSTVPDPANTRWVRAATVLDARLSQHLASWELALNVRNLLDKQYLVNCSYGLCYPADRREVMGTATYRW